MFSQFTFPDKESLDYYTKLIEAFLVTCAAVWIVYRLVTAGPGKVISEAGKATSGVS